MKTALLFGVHGHQPSGNFDRVIVEAHAKCYRPFFETLYRHPAFHYSVHLSGWLLEVLLERFPEDTGRLKEMVARGQAEIFSSGHFEPVLSVIPMRDRIGQLEMNASLIEREFAARPRGAWLTERVWEANVVPALHASGIRYVTVDDYHFLCAGKSPQELDGHYTTEEDGEPLDLFPISEALRYRLPFSPAAEAVAYLEGLAAAGHRAAIYFDDIEKFGIWPETWEWVYEKRWLEEFIERALASEHLATMTYAEFHAREPARGPVYLPTTSYAEMNEWTLPANRAEEYDALLEREQASGTLAATRPFLRGGIWRNFFTLYAESNWMHKRMLGLSRRLAQAPADFASAELRRKLYAAQANDAYWHGLFGGLYLPHLRRAVWRNMIELEAALDARIPRPPIARGDVDLDGVTELQFCNRTLQVAVRLDGHAAALELVSYPLAHNFADSLRRYPQAYFARHMEPRNDAPQPGGIASAHDRAGAKHSVTAGDLAPDTRPRNVMIDSRVLPDGTRDPVDRYRLDAPDTERPEARFAASGTGWRIEKRLGLEHRRLVARYRFFGDVPARLEIELNIAMPSCDGFGGRYVLENGEMPCGFGQALDLERCNRLALDDRELGGGLALATSAPVAVRARPHHTVSRSEAGIEKIMQSACVTLCWTIETPGAKLEIVLEPYPDSA
ncbi:MAG: alpha-amylase/4-alpha-glucanotransferase domain-containing protein [Burkholderiales bacterium]